MRSLFGERTPTPVRRRKSKHQPPPRERPSFMKYNTKVDSSTLTRTREHSRKLASTLPDVSSPMSFASSAQQSFAAFADFENAFGASPEKPPKKKSLFDEDPFSPEKQQQHFAVDWPEETTTATTLTMKSMTRNSSMQKSYTQQQRAQRNVSPPRSSVSSSSGSRRRPGSSNHNSPKRATRPADLGTNSSIRQSRSNSNRSVSSASGHSTTSVSNTSASNRSVDSSDLNLFDSSTNAGGFTFDAFGLDASQINREVSLALKDITSGKELSYYMDQDPSDDFATNNWDSSSPNNSRSATPTQDGGFVDGFRVKTLRNSPGSTEQTSMTSESSNGRRNLVAGFSSIAVPSLDNDSPPKKKEDVEFYDSDSSTSEGNEYYENGVGSDAALASDVGVSSEVAFSSDVGVHPNVDVTQMNHEFVPPEVTPTKKKMPRYSLQSTAATIQSSPPAGDEEKKEDDSHSEVPSVGNLRAQLESKSPPRQRPSSFQPYHASSYDGVQKATKSEGRSDASSEFNQAHVNSVIASIRAKVDGAKADDDRQAITRPAPDSEDTTEKPMTYRERREMELQREREAMRQSQIDRKKMEPASKVASLMERRTGGMKPASLSMPESPRRRESPLKPENDDETKSDLVIETSSVAEGSVHKSEASATLSKLLELQRAHQSSPPKSPRKQTDIVEPPREESPQKALTPKATMIMLNAFLAGRDKCAAPEPKRGEEIVFEGEDQSRQSSSHGDASAPAASNNLPALKEDPKYERYFRMLKVGMPMEAVKHAMIRDGMDPSVMDGDHNKAAGVPLKEDPMYQKYFKMMKVGLPMDAVKHAMERDGLDSSVMDQDHNLPAGAGKKKEDKKEKDSHRRARLHWNTLRKVTSNSLWAKIDQDDMLSQIKIDEDEFQELFQVEKDSEPVVAQAVSEAKVKKGPTVRVIDPKRANNGGIVLARLKLSYDEMADAVDRVNEKVLDSEQLENIIEYLPTAEERKKLESYMLEGGQDAAEKFESLSECEKFMVSMMTVKHAKRKVRALLFRLQFESCVEEIYKESNLVESACDNLSHSVRLRQLLGIILTFGNRLNTAGTGTTKKAGAFTLDSLLKLNQAKAFDKKTTFLQYIVMIVQRNNEILLNFKDDLPAVFEADRVYWDQCQSDLEEVENQLENVRRMALYQARQTKAYRLKRKKQKNDDESLSDEGEIELSLEEEVDALRATHIGLFTLSAIKYVSSLRDKVEQTKVKFANLREYFGEDERKTQPHELFNTIATFVRDFEKAKEQVFADQKRQKREERKKQASKEMDGRPPPHSSSKPALPKASNHQPSMSSVLQEMKHRAPAENAKKAAPSMSSVLAEMQQQKMAKARAAFENPGNAPQTSRTPPRSPNRTSSVVASARSTFEPTKTSSPSRTSTPPRSPSRSTPSKLEGKIQRLQSSPSRSRMEMVPKKTSPPQNVTSSTMAAMRHKARMRRERQAQYS